MSVSGSDNFRPKNSNSSYDECRIALFIPSLEGGGAERVLVTLANCFCDSVMQVDLVIASKLSGAYVNEVSDRVRVFELGESRVLRSVGKLAKYLRQNHPDVLLSTIAHSSIAAYWAVCLRGVSGTRFYARESNSQPKVGLDEKSFFQKLLSIAAGNCYRNAAGVISLSEVMTDNLISEYRLTNPIVTICNPVLTSDFNERSRMQMSPPLPWVETKQVIVTAGRMTKQKDHLTLLKAFQSVVIRYPNAKLVILGDGPMRSQLEAYVHDNSLSGCVWMPGFMEEPLPYFASAKVFVLSSIHEGSPNALIQAIACGVSVVSTDCPTGPAEILDGGRMGELVPVRDHRALALAIGRSLSADRFIQEHSREIQRKYDAYARSLDYLAFMFPESNEKGNMQSGSCGLQSQRSNTKCFRTR